MLEGPLAALDAIEKATGEKEVNAIGYCLGGTLLAATLAYMAAKKDKRIASATFMTSLDRLHRRRRARGVHRRGAGRSRSRSKMNERGYLEGSEMANTFNMLRAQRPDLVVRHQQLPAGPRSVPVRPAALELRLDAHAGDDAQLLPAQHVHEEPAARARRHHARRRADRPVEGHGADVFRLGDRGSHRAVEDDLRGPAARSAASRASCCPGPGHIAGMINPPAANKYGYWTNDKLPRRRRRMARRREAARRLVVERLARPGSSRSSGRRWPPARRERAAGRAA